MASSPTRQQILEEIIKCGKNPIHFIQNYVYIQHPTRGKIKFDTYKYQDDCIADFIAYRFNIVLKARQLGLSTLVAAYCLWLAIFHKDKSILILATKLDVAQNFMKKVKFMKDSLPPWLVLAKVTAESKKHLQFSNGSQVKAIPTTEDAGRSEALTMLIVDEAAFIEGFEEIYKGIFPTLSCVVGDTKVLTPNGFKEIQEFCKDFKIGDYFSLKGDVFGKNGLEPLSHGYVSPESNTLKITTKKGFELEVTRNHPLYKLCDDGGRMSPAKELKVGDYLRIQKNMQIFSKDDSIKNHPTVKRMTPNFAYMLGGYTTEGYQQKSDGKYNSIIVSSPDEEFRKVYLDNAVVKNFHPQKNTIKLICCSVELVDLFSKVGVVSSHKCDEKIIPTSIWSQPKANISAYLSGLYDGSGSVSSKSIILNSASHKLLLEIQLLLCNFGIVSSIAKNNRDKIWQREQKNGRLTLGGKQLQSLKKSWNLHILRSEYKNFYDQIGFRIKRKQNSLKLFSEKFKQNDEKSFNIPVSIFSKKLSEIIEKIGMSGRALRFKGLRIDKFTTDRLKTVSPTFIKKLKQFLPTFFTKDHEFLNELEGDFFWDEIKFIEKSVNKTYDFTVPGTHSFLQNGILGSNTGGRAILISSPKGTSGVFYDTWVSAEAKKNEFNPIKLPWDVHPEHGPDWLASQAANMSAKDLAQEHLCDFQSSGDTYMAAGDIQWVKDNVRPPSEMKGYTKDIWVWKPPTPEHRYFISADVSRGDAKDYSTFQVIDVNECEVVAEYQGKIAPEKFHEPLIEIGTEYNMALICQELNTYGYACGVELKKSGYPNLYYEKYPKESLQGLPINDDDAMCGYTTHLDRPLMLEKLDSLIRNKILKTYSSRLAREFETFIYNGKKALASKGKNDDLVMALAIGVWLVDLAAGKNSVSGYEMAKALLAQTGHSSRTVVNVAGIDRRNPSIYFGQNSFNNSGSPQARSPQYKEAMEQYEGLMRKPAFDPYDFSWVYPTIKPK